jgi:hypothetical protein
MKATEKRGQPERCTGRLTQPPVNAILVGRWVMTHPAL